MERVKYNAKQWEKLFQDYKDSGLGAKEWCESKVVTRTSFYYWRRKLNANLDSNNSKWASVSLAGQINKPMGVELKIRFGRFEIEVSSEFDKTRLKEAVSVLMELC